MIMVFLRTAVVYVAIIAIMRVMGKRQIGELQPNELVTTILISNLASLPIEETDLPLTAVAVPMLLIVSLEVLTSYAIVRSPKVSQLISGKNKIVVLDGQLDQKALAELRYTVDDLLEALRSKGVFDVRDVDFALVETSGKLNLRIKGHDNKNDPSDSYKPVQFPVVVEGQMNPSFMKACGIGQKWLLETLRKNRTELSDVLLMQCDGNRNYYIVWKA